MYLLFVCFPKVWISKSLQNSTTNCLLRSWFLDFFQIDLVQFRWFYHKDISVLLNLLENYLKLIHLPSNNFCILLAGKLMGWTYFQGLFFVNLKNQKDDTVLYLCPLLIHTFFCPNQHMIFWYAFLSILGFFCLKAVIMSFWKYRCYKIFIVSYYSTIRILCLLWFIKLAKIKLLLKYWLKK